MSRSLPPHAYFVGSAVFHYLGPAFAVLLFASIDPLGVAWLRIVTAAAVFALWRRPWHAYARLRPSQRRTIVWWGVVLAVMNSAFYLAIDRLPLGTVAAIEFLPVIVLAAVAARTCRNAAALAFAVAGVYLLTDVAFVTDPIGLVFAAANALLFAVYVMLAHRVASDSSVAGIDGLAIAMLIAAAVGVPLGIAHAGPAFVDPMLLASALGVGVASSVVPYVCDQLAMARLARATYSLMVSLLPATATVIGVLVLAQLPTLVEVLGIGLVIGGVALHQERKSNPRPAASPDHVDV
ncbi:EamA family transporter [Nocardioidaceae bacterium SCSIO 66511]|nr:EamA family transporter [Nocardioidaceae bacterium SCSIO 66511]